jgi:hypothetical protein
LGRSGTAKEKNRVKYPILSLLNTICPLFKGLKQIRQLL